MTGTQNHEGLAGATAAVDYLASLGGAPGESRRAALVSAMTAIKEYERGLSERLVAGLLGIAGLTFYGIRESERFASRTPTVSFRMAGRTPRQVAEDLSAAGIFATNGNYYALGISERLGVEELGGMVRIGLAHYNTAEEVDYLLSVLAR